MKVYYTIVSLFLVGCCTTPVTVPFPDAPATLKAKCENLTKIENKEENRKLSVLEKTVAENYGKYHKCAEKNDAWIEWYEAQKKAYEKLNKK